MNHCVTCKKPLDQGEAGDEDCGGDCRECMARAGDPAHVLEYIEESKKLRQALKRAQEMWRAVSAKINYGASFFDADSISLMNSVPVEMEKAMQWRSWHTTCPYCGRSGPDYIDSDPPTGYCHH